MNKKILKRNSAIFLAITIPVSLFSSVFVNVWRWTTNTLAVNQSAETQTNALPETLEDLTKLSADEIASYSKYDSRKYNLVTEVEEQVGPICWSYALASTAETAILRESLTSYTNTSEELHIRPLTIDEVTNIRNFKDDKLGLNGYDTYNKGTQHGYSHVHASRIFLQGRGPYAISNWLNKTDRPIAYLENMIKFSGTTGKYDWTKSENIMNVKKLIAKYGSVAISYASTYQGNSIFFNSSITRDINHAVQIVGWDDTIDRNEYETSSRASTMDGGWIVKNSWGKWKADNGFFYLSYDSPLVDIMALDFGPNNSYDNNYYWDGYDYDSNTTLGVGENEYAAIFPVKKASYNTRETLKQISFGIGGKNVDVTAKIYKNVEADPGNRSSSKNKPDSGTLVDTITSRFEYPGFYTLKLNKPVELQAGEYFSVVITTSNERNDGELTFSSEPHSLNDLTYYKKNGKWINSANNNNLVAQIRAQTSSEVIAPEQTSNDLKYADVRIREADIRNVYRYKENGHPSVDVKFENKQLEIDKDYTVTLEDPTLDPPKDSWSDKDLVASGNLKITGIGQYSGHTIVKYPITIAIKPDVSSFGQYQPNGNIIIEAGEGIHSYSDINLPEGWRFVNSDALLQSGANENPLIYDGHDAKCFRSTWFNTTVNKTGSVASKKDITSAKVTLDNYNFVYSGNPYTPTVTSVSLNGATITSNNYDVTYKNNVNAGSGQVIVKGKNDYAGSVEVTFQISKAQNAIVKFEINENNTIDVQSTYGQVRIGYYKDKECTQLVPQSDKLQPGTYYVKAYVEAGDNYEACSSDVKELVIKEPVDQQVPPNINDNNNNNNGTTDNNSGGSTGNNQNQSSDGSNQSNANPANSLSTGAIVAISIASIVAVGAIFGTGYWLINRKNK